MIRLRSFAALLTVLLAGLTFVSGPSYADPGTEADAAGAAFAAGQHVYVSPEAGQTVDSAAVADAIGTDRIYIAVVPPNTPPADVITQLQNSLQQKGTFVVVSGTEQAAQSNVICSTKAQPLLDSAAKDQAKTRDSGDLTAFLTSYVDKVGSAPEPGDSDCGDETSSSGGFMSALPWVLGALVLGAGGGYLWLRNRQQKKATRDAGRHAKVAEALDALARDIDSVGDGGGPHVQRALQDARERHIAAVDILADADSDVDFDAAARATREGAFAAHYARERAGLRSTAPRQVEPARGERLSAERSVLVGEEQVTAYPEYRPGAPYYFGGTDELPAGWYTVSMGGSVLLGSIADTE